MSTAPPKVLTLVLIRTGDRKLLMGMKKRGFGEGYLNGFGGKVESGETILEGAIRELEEEAGVTATDLQHCGVLNFMFDDQDRPWETHVFAGTSFAGTPVETEEMAPRWVHEDELPSLYDSMWADDRYWYPTFLSGKAFIGTFWFTDTHTLQRHELNIIDRKSLPPVQ